MHESKTAANYIWRSEFRQAQEELADLPKQELEQQLLAILDLPRSSLFHPAKPGTTPRLLEPVKEILDRYDDVMKRLVYGTYPMPVRSASEKLSLFPGKVFSMGMVDVLPREDRQRFHDLINESSVLGGKLRQVHLELAKLAEGARHLKLQGAPEAE